MASRLVYGISTFNSCSTLKESVVSVLNQTFKDLEVWVVDDQSTDSTQEVLDSISDSRLKVIRNETRKGLASSLNYILQHSDSEFFGRLDADDIARPERSAVQVELLESRSRVGVVGSYMQAFGNQNGIWRRPTNSSSIKAFTLFECPFFHPTVMIRRSILSSLGSTVYNPSFSKAQDYDLWSRLLWRTDYFNLNKVLVDYRTHSSQASSADLVEQESFARQVWQRLLLEIGIPEPEVNLNLHQCAARSKCVTTSELHLLEQWLSIVLKRAISFGRYNQRNLHFEIFRRWASVCRSSRISIIRALSKGLPNIWGGAR